MITVCTDCGKCYQAGSEEQANEPERWCVECFRRRNVKARVEPDRPRPPATSDWHNSPC